jgi:hypothetical protein
MSMPTISTRGTMMSSTVAFSRSRMLMSICRCRCGIMAPASATTVRSSSLLNEWRPAGARRPANAARRSPEIGRPDERIQHREQQRVHVGGGGREALRVQGAEGLGRDLAEDEQDEGERDHPGRDQIIAAQAKGDETHQGGRDHVHHGAQQKDEADQPVRMGEKRLGQARAPMPHLGAVAQPIAVQAHERGLAAREECGQQQENPEGREQNPE